MLFLHHVGCLVTEYSSLSLTPTQAQREHARLFRRPRNALLETVLACREETQRRTRSLLNLSYDVIATQNPHDLPRWNSSTRVDRPPTPSQLKRVANVPRSPLRIEPWRMRGARRRAYDSSVTSADEGSLDSQMTDDKMTSFLDSEAAVQLSMSFKETRTVLFSVCI